MTKSFANRLRGTTAMSTAILWIGVQTLSLAGAATAVASPLGVGDNNTTSPIKHVIIIIGENRTFDHVFATYKPRAGQTVLNLLSEGIVKADGQPGPNFNKVAQFGQPKQFVGSQPGNYMIAPPKTGTYATLPAPGASGAPTTASDTDPPPFATLTAAANYEYGLYPGQLALITTGATGLANTHTPDTRITNDASLPNGPFQLTGPTLPADSYTGSPVHRFYQMWQQADCDVSHATAQNPSGCLSDLFPWAETTVDTGSNGAPPPTGYNPATYQNVEGASAMGFFNMAKGDVPYFKQLAQKYSISDNFHQSVMGGTGANHLMFGYADGVYYTNDGTTPSSPPAGQIENPNSQSGTNNFWVNDGYGSTATNDGGSYSNCSDTSQPGVAAVTNYLTTVHVNSKCATGAYYLLNNYNPGYVGNGTVDPTVDGPFTIPPTSQRHIGDDLNAKSVSWAYFGESWNDYVVDPNGQTNPAGYLYCNICNPFQYSTQTMTNEQQRLTHIHDTTDLYNDISSGDLPAVSIVKPNALNDGHPVNSKLNLFESFTHKVIAEVQANKKLWANTVIFITFDEGGGYWDSGYIQPVDFFGDGTRIPLIAVSPFTAGGYVNHSYADHVSLDKFIERNWSLGPITNRSRDNLPNPQTGANPYVPVNGPSL